jgi:hypothetical protein
MPPKKTKTTTIKDKSQKAEWTLNGKKDFIIPEKAIGFIYLIEIIGTPFYYYGKKNLTSTRGRGKKAVTKESTWRNYESSSKEVKELIKSGKKIKKTILEFAYSKSELTLKETQAIICNNCLTDSNSLNRWVYCRVYQKNLVNNNN